MLNKIIESLQEVNATPYLVGGCVRDKLLGFKSKDIDIEVFNIELEALIKVLSRFGKVKGVGKSFGVMKLTTSNNEYDFSLPRRDNKVKAGHKGFVLEFDPSMTLKEAASRRDFTINTLMQEPSGKLVDYFGGVMDLDKKLLRHTSQAFGEDPLRVLRGFQFAGRFGLTMVKETIELSKTLVNEFPSLPKERIYTELWKWATKSIKPSKGLEVLEQTNWLDKFYELARLKGCLQNPRWHPEGNAWEHTKQVCDSMAELCTKHNIKGERKGILLLASLLHDIGKPETTVKNEIGSWVSPKHAVVGASIAKRFLLSLNTPNHIIDKVSFLVHNHMWIQSLTKMTKPITRRMIYKLNKVALPIKDLALLIEADHSGRHPLPKHQPPLIKEALIFAEQIGDEVKPIILGRHLIALGLKPSPQFGIILKHMLEKQIEEVFDNIDVGLLELEKTLSKCP